MKSFKIVTIVMILMLCIAFYPLKAQEYIHPDFVQQWALTDVTSPAFTAGGTWQQTIYRGVGKVDFFASYSSENGNETWEFFGFSDNKAGGYDVTWNYIQTGMSGSLEANERMMVVGDWNSDGKDELIIGIDPEAAALPNLLVFEPDAAGNLPATPTATLVTPKASRWFGTAFPLHYRFSWSAPPGHVRDIDKDGVNEFVGFGYSGLIVGKYSGAWTNPNAADEVVWTYPDSAKSVAGTLADLDGNGYVEMVNTSPTFFGPGGPNDLPGSYHRQDYFAITEQVGINQFITYRMARLDDSLRMANGYKAQPANFMGGFHAVATLDIDNDGKEEVFVADWGPGGPKPPAAAGQRFWMIDIGNKAVANIDSTDFYELANFRNLFTAPYPDPMHPAALQVADMDGDGHVEFYTGLGPWGDAGGQCIARVKYLGGDAKVPASWKVELVYRDDTHNLVARQVLAVKDMDGDGKDELVFTNANGSAEGGCLVVIESKMTTSVDEYDNHIPLAYSLDQNYPNPFNPITIINYSVPINSLVKLRVLNLLGMDVGVLVNKQHETGKYQIAFDASKLPSGIYFYKIEIGDFSAVKKMILLK